VSVTDESPGDQGQDHSYWSMSALWVSGEKWVKVCT